MIKKIVYAISLIFLLSACGYKPLSYYSRSVLNQKIYVQTEVSISDPKNSLIIKDALNEAILKRFGASLAKKEEADTIIKAKIKSIDFKPIAFDKHGYILVYQAEVLMSFVYESATNSTNFEAKGKYDFMIGQNSVISETDRYNAIKEASLEAIDKFIFHIGLKGAK